MSAMTVDTLRFGKVEYDDSDLLIFPRGIPAFENNHNWILAGSDDSAIRWLQNIEDGSLALLIVVSVPDGAPWNMTANLRAPILVNVKTHKAVQVIALNEEYPIRHMIFPEDVREKMKAKAQKEGC